MRGVRSDEFGFEQLYQPFFVEKMEQVAGWTGVRTGVVQLREHSQNGEPFTQVLKR
ncbi:MAG: hypothetical protein ACLVK0_13420 [Parabacteroides merdae]